MNSRIRLQEPIAEYVAEEDCARAKLFANGRSQAIRLPKQFRMPGKEVLIHKEGKRLIIEPVEEVERDANGYPLGFWEKIHSMTADIDDEWECPEDPVPPPIPPYDET